MSAEREREKVRKDNRRVEAKRRIVGGREVRNTLCLGGRALLNNI
jgi:hypothetical protein